MAAVPSNAKILIVRTGAMGDVLHALPAVAALRSTMPDAKIGWAIEPRWEPLLRDAMGDMPVIDHAHRAETKSWSRSPVSMATLRSVRGLWKQLREEKYDVCIDLQGSIRSALIARLSGATLIVGSDAPRETPARWMYTRRVTTQQQHVIEQAGEIVSGAIGISLPALQQSASFLPRDPDAEAWADGVVKTGERVAMIAPGAGWGAKQWPAEKYGAVAMELHAMGLHVLVNAVPGGDALAAAVVTASNGRAEAVECSVAQLIALMRRMQLFVGGDTGPLHLASALQVPVVGLFGPTDPARNGPWGTRNAVLRNAGSVTDHRRHTATEAGLEKIRVEDVVRAARSLLQERMEG